MKTQLRLLAGILSMGCLILTSRCATADEKTSSKIGEARSLPPAPAKPAGLKPGDTIALVAPSGEVDLHAVRLATDRLQARGFDVQVSDTVDRRRGYLAGEDHQRADELMAAFADPDVDAILAIAGGYGTTRILDSLDYEVIAAHPKILVGFSDITGLHLAIAAKCNLVTFHGPNIEYGIGLDEGLPRFHSRYFWQNLQAEGQERLEYLPPARDLPIHSIRGGVARGRLIGGNLSLVAALMGTPYEIRTARRVLFLEDIHEAPYRVDRMLSQLRLAGKLDSPAAVVLGSYHRCTADEEDSSLTLDQVFDDYFGQAPYPVIKDAPCGHGPWNALLPLGAMVEVNGDAPSLTRLERPVRDVQ